MFAEGGLWVCEVGEGGQKAQTSNYRKVTPGIIMCSIATIANNTIKKLFCVFESCWKSGSKKSSSHTQKMSQCEMMGVRWTYHGDSVTIYTDSESLCCTPNMSMKGCVSYASIRKQKMVEGWYALSQLLRKVKLWALHQGLWSSLPLSKVKDAYSLAGSRWDRPGALHFSHAPRKCQFLRIPGCTLSSKVSELLRVEISWAGF